MAEDAAPDLLYLYAIVFVFLCMRSFAFVWRHRVVQGMRGHNGRFGAGLSHRYPSDKWMRESCYPLCGWLSAVGLYTTFLAIHINVLNFKLS